ncbi:MAG: hypothetical protein QSU88_04280, partial [Candidatus Methanoperedens sp.]|nr:hypothetical protein [Candidatus Methanoperedens sp.]
SRKQVLDALDKAQELVQVTRKITIDIEQTERSIKENEKKIVSLKKEIEEKQEAQNHLYAGEPWIKYTRSKDELVLLEIQKIRSFRLRLYLLNTVVDESSG